MDVIQGFHVNIEKHLTTICGKLENIDGRMNKLEDQQKVLEDGLKSSTLQSSCSSQKHEYKRTRVTPTALQVTMKASCIWIPCTYITVLLESCNFI